MNLGGQLRRVLFAIPTLEVSFDRRRFRGGGSGVRERIESIGRTVLAGYHGGLSRPDTASLEEQLQRVQPEWRGYAAEGVAIALALLDVISPWNRHHLRRFLAGPGGPHAHMVHLGVGWLFSRLPFGLQPRCDQLDPLLRWLAYDGYGFHEGFFNWPCYLGGQRVSPRLQGYECRAFDQGLGRSLWFIDGTEVSRLPDTIGAFPAARQPDLWSGLGFAVTYAGGVNGEALRRLHEMAGPYQSHLAQGAAFAARTRFQAGNVGAATTLACLIFCGSSVERAVQATSDALDGLDVTAADPPYEQWRRHLQFYFERAGALSPRRPKVGRYD